MYVAFLVEKVLLRAKVEVVDDQVALLLSYLSTLSRQGSQRPVELIVALVEMGEQLMEELCLSELLLLREVAKP